jgi:hypothetical protein
MEPIISIILLLTPVAVFILLALKNLLDILKFKNIKEIVRDTDFLKLLGIPVGIILVLILIGYLFETKILDILLANFFIFGLFDLLPVFPGRWPMNRNQNLTKLAGGSFANLREYFNYIRYYFCYI